MTKARECVIAASVAAMACVALSMSAFAQGPLPGQPEFGKLLVEAAQASPGCLGVKLGRTGDGTNVIFAWFENKRKSRSFHHRVFLNLPRVRPLAPPRPPGQRRAKQRLK